MNDYMVYFEMFGKKMKVKIQASSVAEARQKVVSQIKFHKVVKESDPAVERIMNLFGMKP